MCATAGFWQALHVEQIAKPVLQGRLLRCTLPSGAAGFAVDQSPAAGAWAAGLDRPTAGRGRSHLLAADRQIGCRTALAVWLGAVSKVMMTDMDQRAWHSAAGVNTTASRAARAVAKLDSRGPVSGPGPRRETPVRSLAAVESVQSRAESAAGRRVGRVAPSRGAATRVSAIRLK
jgi:hypothetical protein